MRYMRQISHFVRRQSKGAGAQQRGFTLVEMLVVTPIVILVLVGIVTLVVSLTTGSLQTSARAQLQNEVQAALDLMEEDIRTALRLDSASPDVLRSENFATNKNPLASDRRLVKKDCTVATSGLIVAEALTYDLTYASTGRSLTRSVGLKGCHSSTDVWQRVGTEQIIKDADTELKLEYIANGGVSPHAVKITLTAKRLIAGADISYTGVMYAQLINSQ